MRCHARIRADVAITQPLLYDGPKAVQNAGSLTLTVRDFNHPFNDDAPITRVVGPKEHGSLGETPERLARASVDGSPSFRCANKGASGRHCMSLSTGIWTCTQLHVGSRPDWQPVYQRRQQHRE